MKAKLVTRANDSDDLVITISRTQATELLSELRELGTSEEDFEVITRLKRTISEAMTRLPKPRG